MFFSHADMKKSCAGFMDEAAFFVQLLFEHIRDISLRKTKNSYPETRDKSLRSCGTTQIDAKRPLFALTRLTSNDYPVRPHGAIRCTACAPFPPPGALCAVWYQLLLPIIGLIIFDILCSFFRFVKCQRCAGKTFAELGVFSKGIHAAATEIRVKV